MIDMNLVLSCGLSSGDTVEEMGRGWSCGGTEFVWKEVKDDTLSKVLVGR